MRFEEREKAKKNEAVCLCLKLKCNALSLWGAKTKASTILSARCHFSVAVFFLRRKKLDEYYFALQYSLFIICLYNRKQWSSFFPLGIAAVKSGLHDIERKRESERMEAEMLREKLKCLP